MGNTPSIDNNNLVPKYAFLIIAQYLTLRNLLNLEQCCKTFFGFLCDENFWRCKCAELDDPGFVFTVDVAFKKQFIEFLKFRPKPEAPSHNLRIAFHCSPKYKQNIERIWREWGAVNYKAVWEKTNVLVDQNWFYNYGQGCKILILFNQH